MTTNKYPSTFDEVGGANLHKEADLSSGFKLALLSLKGGGGEELWVWEMEPDLTNKINVLICRIGRCQPV